MVVAEPDGSHLQVASDGVGAHFSPDWSPDGKRLAYVTELPTGPLKHILRIRDLATGATQSFEGLGSSFGGSGTIGHNPRFSPDASRILVRWRNAFFVANLETGQESRAYFDGRPFGDIAWNDATHVFVMEFTRGIWRVDLDTGAEEAVFSLDRGTFMGRGLTIAPDHQRLGFVVLGATRSAPRGSRARQACRDLFAIRAVGPVRAARSAEPILWQDGRRTCPPRFGRPFSRLPVSLPSSA